MFPYNVRNPIIDFGEIVIVVAENLHLKLELLYFKTVVLNN